MFYQIPQLKNYPGLYHAFSTADDGNMSFKWGDEPEVRQNRRKLLAQLNIDPARVVSAELEHSDKIINVTSRLAGNGVLDNDYKLKADSLITNETGLYLWHIVADCSSVIIYDPTNQAIGLVHVGRKNASLDIIGQTVKKMTNLYHSKPDDLVVGLGPTIKDCCYALKEVEQIKEPIWQDFLAAKNNLIYINLTGFIIRQLQLAGVNQAEIYTSPECTAHGDKFFSHYRSQQQNQPEARFAAIIGLI